MSEDKYKVIFIVGPPGVGKNTQCDKLVEKYKLIHFGAGDLLRAEAKKDTEEGKLINSIISQGKIVPVKITCSLLKKAMDESGKKNIFLIDGYPRNQDNIDGWNEVFGDNYKLITSIILGCDEELLEKRLLQRAQHSGRSDDKVEVIKKRFKVYVEQSQPIEAKLKLMGPFIEVKADGTIDEVFQKISQQLDEKLKE
jgi:UMP-CMP kinase